LTEFPSRRAEFCAGINEVCAARMLQPAHGGSMSGEWMIGISWGGVFIMAVLAIAAVAVMKSKMMR
jgi:hypothetical protein